MIEGVSDRLPCETDSVGVPDLLLGGVRVIVNPVDRVKDLVGDALPVAV